MTKTSVLIAVLVAAVLAIPAFAQSGGAEHGQCLRDVLAPSR